MLLALIPTGLSPPKEAPGWLILHDKDFGPTHAPTTDKPTPQLCSWRLEGDGTWANTSRSSCWNGASQVFDSVNYESSWPASQASPRKAPAAWNLLPVALPLSPHLAASRRHFKRCFYLLQRLVHFPARPPLWHFGPEVCFLQLWQSSVRFQNPVFKEMAVGRELPTGSPDLGFLVRVSHEDLPHDSVGPSQGMGQVLYRRSLWLQSWGPVHRHSTWAPHSYIRFHCSFTVHTGGSGTRVLLWTASWKKRFHITFLPDLTPSFSNRNLASHAMKQFKSQSQGP